MSYSLLHETSLLLINFINIDENFYFFTATEHHKGRARTVRARCTYNYEDH